MVAAGQIFASISDADGGMVRFLEDPLLSANPAAAAQLTEAVAAAAALSERLAAARHQLATSKDYLKKVRCAVAELITSTPS
jgi:hypothetical protein